MSEVYVLEPPTNGKVVLHTSHGSVDIELWTKECPKTCRNFLQLCVDGYYDNTIFHRIIPDFIIQGGDPTGTGLGGESIFGNKPFPLEIHPRLMYRHRGLVGLATLNPEDEGNARLDPDRKFERTHGSQFFITLSRADSLNRKNTLFGKVTGNSLYNLLSMSETPVDLNTGRPKDPPKLLSVEVLYCPFHDITPRSGSVAMLRQEQEENALRKKEEKQTKSEHYRGTLSTKKTNLLSFGVEEEEEEEGENTEVDFIENEPLARRDYSSNEIPLKQFNASCKNDIETRKYDSNQRDDDDSGPLRSMSVEHKQEKARLLKERIAKRLNEGKMETEEEAETVLSPAENESDPETSPSSSEENNTEEEAEVELECVKKRRRENREEIERLKKDILSFKKGEGTVGKEVAEVNRVEDADLLTVSERRRRLNVARHKQSDRKRQQLDVYAKMKEFQSRLLDLSSTKNVSSQEQPDTDDDHDAVPENWFVGDGLRFAVDSARAYELDAAKDALITIDPLALRPKAEVEEKMRRLKNMRLKPSLKGDI